MTAGGRLERIVEAAKRRPDLVVLAVLVLAGGGLRFWLMLQWRPAFLGYSDTVTYLGNSEGPGFYDGLRPIGYSVFLWAVRKLSTELSSAILLQHMLGLAAALLLYAAVRRLGVGRWAALLPAAVLLLHGTTIWFEHSVISEPSFTFLICAAFLPAALAADERRALWQRAALGSLAGLLLAAAATVRPIGAVLLPLFVLWLVWAVPGRWRERLVAGAAVAATGAALLGANLIWAHDETGHWALVRDDFYILYGRVATFADCDKFTPPEGTEVLCPTRSRRDRSGAAAYVFSPDTELVQAFGNVSEDQSPEDAELVDSFNRAAILGQPGDYLTVVGRDLVRLVDPNFPSNPNPAIGNIAHGATPEEYQSHLPAHDEWSQGIEEGNLTFVRRSYTTEGMLRKDIGALESYEGATRLIGIPWVIGVLLALAGPVLTTGRVRRGALLLTASAFALAIAPPMFHAYDWRFQVPVFGPLAAAAAFGVHGAAARLRLRRSGRAAP